MFQLRDYSEAITITDFFVNADIPREDKIAILQEIKNVVPYGAIAGQYKLLAEATVAYIGKRLAGLEGSVKGAPGHKASKEAA